MIKRELDTTTDPSGLPPALIKDLVQVDRKVRHAGAGWIAMIFLVGIGLCVAIYLRWITGFLGLNLEHVRGGWLYFGILAAAYVAAMPVGLVCSHRAFRRLRPQLVDRLAMDGWTLETLLPAIGGLRILKHLDGVLAGAVYSDTCEELRARGVRAFDRFLGLQYGSVMDDAIRLLGPGSPSRGTGDVRMGFVEYGTDRKLGIVERASDHRILTFAVQSPAVVRELRRRRGVMDARLDLLGARPHKIEQLLGQRGTPRGDALVFPFDLPDGGVGELRCTCPVSQSYRCSQVMLRWCPPGFSFELASTPSPLVPDRGNPALPQDAALGDAGQAGEAARWLKGARAAIANFDFAKMQREAMALPSTADFRVVADPRSGLWADIARCEAKLGNFATALDDTKSLGKSRSGSMYCEELLCDIAKYQLARGQPEAALSTISMTPLGRPGRELMLFRIADRYARDKRIDTARDILRQGSDASRWAQSIIPMLAEHGHCAEALALLDSVPATERGSAVLWLVAKAPPEWVGQNAFGLAEELSGWTKTGVIFAGLLAQVRCGHLKTASGTLASLKEQGFPPMGGLDKRAYGRLLAALGDSAEGAKWIGERHSGRRKIGQLKYVAVQLHKIGLTAQAKLLLAFCDEEWPAVTESELHDTMVEVTKAWITFDESGRVLELAAARGSAFTRATCLMLVTEAMCDRHNGGEAGRVLASAEVHVASEPNPRNRMFLERHLALLQVRAGNQEAARRTLASAFEKAEALTDVLDRAYEQSLLVEAQARVGDVAEAVTRARAIPDSFPSHGSNALAAIALVQFERGHADEAFRLLESIPRGDVRASGFIKIANRIAGEDPENDPDYGLSYIPG
ncbi:MAG: hypothetical protein WAZ94_04415 [Phycisphaerales bacterium]